MNGWSFQFEDAANAWARQADSTADQTVELAAIKLELGRIADSLDGLIAIGDQLVGAWVLIAKRLAEP